jgi:hypothetical protein
MTEKGTMSTPRRRRRDREPLTQIPGISATSSNLMGDIRNGADLAIEPTHEDIALRAYQLFEERGGEHGDDLKDWLQAERELRDRAVVDVLGRILAMGGPYAAA